MKVLQRKTPLTNVVTNLAMALFHNDHEDHVDPLVTWLISRPTERELLRPNLERIMVDQKLMDEHFELLDQLGVLPFAHGLFTNESFEEILQDGFCKLKIGDLAYLSLHITELQRISRAIKQGYYPYWEALRYRKPELNPCHVKEFSEFRKLLKKLGVCK